MIFLCLGVAWYPANGTDFFPFHYDVRGCVVWFIKFATKFYFGSPFITEKYWDWVRLLKRRNQTNRKWISKRLFWKKTPLEFRWIFSKIKARRNAEYRLVKVHQTHSSPKIFRYEGQSGWWHYCDEAWQLAFSSLCV